MNTVRVIAGIITLGFIILLGAVCVAAGQSPPAPRKVHVVGFEWRGLGFFYVGEKYDGTQDLLPYGHPTQEACLEAMKEAISRVPKLTIVSACVQVPLITQVPIT